MKLISAIAFLFLSSTFGQSGCDDNQSKAIKVPADCPEETPKRFVTITARETSTVSQWRVCVASRHLDMVGVRAWRREGVHVVYQE